MLAKTVEEHQTMIDVHDLSPQLANCRQYWLGWAGSDRSDDDLALYRSDIADAQLNGVLRVTEERELADTVVEVQQRLNGVPWLWWVGPDSAPGTAESLGDHGAAPALTMPVMAIDLRAVRPLPVTPDLVIAETRDLDAWVAAFAPSFGIEPGLVADVAEREKVRPGGPDNSVYFEGRIGGELVGTSQLYVHDGVAGIYVVTVAAAFRRRGIGAALTAAAMAAGQDRGLEVGTLQATPDGLPVYEKMGFEQVANYSIFAFEGAPH